MSVEVAKMQLYLDPAYFNISSVRLLCAGF